MIKLVQNGKAYYFEDNMALAEALATKGDAEKALGECAQLVVDLKNNRFAKISTTVEQIVDRALLPGANTIGSQLVVEDNVSV